LRKLAKITSFTSLMDLRIDTVISRIGEIDVPVVAAGRVIAAPIEPKVL